MDITSLEYIQDSYNNGPYLAFYQNMNNSSQAITRHKLTF